MSQWNRDKRSLVHRELEAKVAIYFEILGHVQGVGFRAHVQRTALQHGLIGWVRNDESGSVVGWAQGPRIQLNRFVQALKPGPAGARIDRIDTMDDILRPVPEGFEIKK
jgi:acylphosphatase